MLDAFLSGAAARVVFVQGNDAWYVDFDEPEAKKPSSIANFTGPLSGATDIVELKNTTPPDAFNRLSLEWSVDRALRLFDLILDGELDNELRVEAVVCLEDLIRDDAVKVQFENILYAVPSQSIFGHSFTEEQQRLLTAQIISGVASRQDHIQSVREKWDRLADSNFQSPHQRRQFEFAAVVRGVFRLLATFDGSGDANSILFRCFELLSDQANYRQVINSWTRDLNVERKRRTIAKDVERRRASDFDETAEGHLYTDSNEAKSVYKLFTNVRQQQEGVIQQLKSGNVGRARKYASELVKSQLSSGEAGFASKSLCLLAQEAKNVGQSSLQLEWLLNAVELSPGDGRAHGQLGDAYLGLYRFDEADKSFANASRLGQEEFAFGGHARLLKASGRLDSALQAFADGIARYGTDEQAHRFWSGYCEVLRDMGNFGAALNAYDEATAAFPDQPVITCGRAGTFADLGELDQAREIYSFAIAKWSDDPAPYGGLASVLVSAGLFEDAIALYDDALLKFPTNAILFGGRAEALSASGRWDDALEAYKSGVRKFPFEPALFCGYAEALRDKGDLAKAIQVYTDAIRRFKLDVRCRGGYANILRVAGQFEESLAEYEKNVADFPYDAFSLNGRARLLRELGQYAGSLEAYDVLLGRLPHYEHARYGRAAVLVILNRFDEASNLLARTQGATRASWAGRRIAAMIAIKQGRFEEALSALSRGEKETQFYQEKKLFENAIALAKLAMGRYSEAVDAARKGTGEIAKVISLHSYLALGEREQAERVYRSIDQNAPPSVIELRKELVAQFDRNQLEAESRAMLGRQTEVFLQAA